MYPVECPSGCGSKPFRKNLDNHLDEKCPLAMLDCFFKYAGCTAQVARRDMPQHRDDYSAEHIVMTMEKIEALERENAALKEQLLSKERELASFRIHQKLLSFSKPKGSIKHLMVSNLPQGTNEQMLKSTFGQFGLVEEIELKNSGEAHVEYCSEISAEAALSQSVDTAGIKLRKQTLHVRAIY